MEVTTFKGLRNDKGAKFIGNDYFYRIQNFNYDDIIGCNRILYPEIVYNGATSDSIWGITVFNWLDAFNVLHEEKVAIIGTNIYKDFDTNPYIIYSGMAASLATFTVYNDKLFISNGVNNTLVYNGLAVYDMGAPFISNAQLSGNLTGAYFYEVTFMTSGGEERIGVTSNTITVSNGQILLELPAGYDGTTARKIYRTEANSLALKLVTTISDNTTLTYTDNLADSSLTDPIVSINNRMPRPAFIESLNDCLVGMGDAQYPTQTWKSDTHLEIWDSTNFNDTANIDGDNTAIVGMAKDYDKIIFGTSKNVYLFSISGTTSSITRIRANVGVKSGYTMKRMPMHGDFDGGVLFVSTLNDVRLVNGNFSTQVSSSIDNLKTDSWSQQIQATLINDLKSSTVLFAEFFDYKYHLVVDYKYYVFDVRTLAWTTYNIVTESYKPLPNCTGIIKDRLLIGQKGSAIIERAYAQKYYRNEPVSAIIQTGQILFDENVKFFKSINIYYAVGVRNKMKLQIAIDGNYDDCININIDFKGYAFNAQYFNKNYFLASNNAEDFGEILINRYGRSLEIKITVDDEYFYFRGYRLNWFPCANKEGIV